VILGFRREVNEKRAFLGYCAANSPQQRSSLEQRATNCLAARLSTAQTYVHISRFKSAHYTKRVASEKRACKYPQRESNNCKYQLTATVLNICKDLKEQRPTEEKESKRI
jgi:hypothetical protein